MATYPEWLMPYKSKGVYVSKRKNGYALYRGHSERVPGKKHPVFKCDEYLGIVTQKDGLIPSSPPVRSCVEVYRYGLWAFARRYCSILYRHLKDKKLNYRLIYSHALLDYEGADTQEGYEGSWLSVDWPGIDMSAPMTEEEQGLLARLKKQLDSTLKARLGDDFAAARPLWANVYAVRVNGKWRVSRIPEPLRAIAASHGVELSIEMH